MVTNDHEYIIYNIMLCSSKHSIKKLIKKFTCFVLRQKIIDICSGRSLTEQFYTRGGFSPKLIKYPRNVIQNFWPFNPLSLIFLYLEELLCLLFVFLVYSLFS